MKYLSLDLFSEFALTINCSILSSSIDTKAFPLNSLYHGELEQIKFSITRLQSDYLYPQIYGFKNNHSLKENTNKQNSEIRRSNKERKLSTGKDQKAN